MKNCLLFLLTTFSFLLSSAQEMVGEYGHKNLIPIAFDGFADEKGNVVVHYIRRVDLAIPQDDLEKVSYANKVYRSCFVFPTAKSGKKIELAYAFTIQAIGYTDTHFVMCLMKRNDLRKVKQSSVTLVLTDKGGITPFRSKDIDLQGEKDVFFFDNEGVIYSISFVKRSSSIRIRRIKEFEIENFDYPVTNGEEEALSGDLVFCSDSREAGYLSTPSNTKVFMLDDKIFLAYQDGKRGKGINLISFTLNPSSLTFIPTDLSGAENFGFYPFGDQLFVYSAQDHQPELTIWDIRSNKIVKKVSTSTGNKLLTGDCLLFSGFSKSEEMKLNEECSDKQRQELISSKGLWFQLWRTAGKPLRLTYGNMTALGNDLYRYKYLCSFVDPDSLEFTNDPGPSQARKLRGYSLLDKKADYSLIYTNHGSYLIGYSPKTDTFTVWK